MLCDCDTCCNPCLSQLALIPIRTCKLAICKCFAMPMLCIAWHLQIVYPALAAIQMHLCCISVLCKKQGDGFLQIKQVWTMHMQVQSGHASLVKLEQVERCRHTWIALTSSEVAILFAIEYIPGSNGYQRTDMQGWLAVQRSKLELLPRANETLGLTD